MSRPDRRLCGVISDHVPAMILFRILRFETPIGPPERITPYCPRVAVRGGYCHYCENNWPGMMVAVQIPRRPSSGYAFSRKGRRAPRISS
jgi:hypothetical protein